MSDGMVMVLLLVGFPAMWAAGYCYKSARMHDAFADTLEDARFDDLSLTEKDGVLKFYDMLKNRKHWR